MLLIIHPSDNSTSFLEPVWNTCIKTIGSEICIYNIGFDEEEHDLAIEEIRSGPYENVLFMGHGSSKSLHGAKSKDYKNEFFIKKKDLDIFHAKKLLCLSCKSSELLSGEKSFDFVGFGELPTEIEEVTAAREFDAQIYTNVDPDVLKAFQDILVSIITKSTLDWHLNNYGMVQVFHRIRLRINKEITNQLISGHLKSAQRQGLIKLLLDMKNEISLHQR